MNIGVIRENNAYDHRVALTPSVVRQLVEHGTRVCVESGAGDRAMFRDDEYIRAGAQLAYSAMEVVHRSELVVKVSVPTLEEVGMFPPETSLVAFYHMAVAARPLLEKLSESRVTAIGCEIIETDQGRLPVLAAISEIAGQMTISLAMHLLRSSSGGRGILLGGSPGVPPAQVVILGSGTVGGWAARTASAAGAHVTVLDIDTDKLRRLLVHLPNVATGLADPDSVAAAAASADVLIGAVLIAGRKTPHVVTRRMVEHMKPGAVIIDVAIDQGGCFETSRPTTLADPTFVHNGVLHYCVPNMTADMGRSTSMALAQALLPYLLKIAHSGVDEALRGLPELGRGIYTHRGMCVQRALADALGLPFRPLSEMLAEAAPGKF